MIRALTRACLWLQIIFPNEVNLRKLVENKGIKVSSSADLEELCKNQAIKDAVLSELNALGKKAGLKPLEVSIGGLCGFAAMWMADANLG